MNSTQHNEEKISIKCENCDREMYIPRRDKKIRVRCPICRYEFDYPRLERNPDNTVENGRQGVDVCPLCKRGFPEFKAIASFVEDGTHRISGVKREWVSSESYGGQWVDVPIKETQQTELAAKLAPPVPPTQPTITFGGCLAFVVTFLFLLIIGSGIFSFLVYTGERNYFQEILSFVGCMSVPVAITGIQILRIRDSKAKYAAELYKWQQEKQIWDRLYYCSFNRKIYDPESNKVFDPVALREYISTK